MKRINLIICFAGLCLIQLSVCGFLIYRWELILRTGEAYRFKTKAVDPYDAFRGRFVAIQLEPDYIASDKPVDQRLLVSGATVYVTVTTGPDGLARFDQCLTEPPAGKQAYIKTTLQYVDTSMNLQPGDVLHPLELAQKMKESDDALSLYLRSHMANYESETINKSLKAGVEDAALSNTLTGILNRMFFDQTLARQLLGTTKIGGSNEHPEAMRAEMDKAYPGQLAPTPRARIHVKLPFDRYYMEENMAPRAEQAYWDHSRNRALERMSVTVRILNGQGLIENLWIGDRTIGEYLKSQNK